MALPGPAKLPLTSIESTEVSGAPIMSSLYDVRVSMHEGSTSSSSKLASEVLAEREEQEAPASTEQADHIDFSAGLPLDALLCRANFGAWNAGDAILRQF